jgi:hypothetical protein
LRREDDADGDLRPARLMAGGFATKTRETQGGAEDYEVADSVCQM